MSDKHLQDARTMAQATTCIELLGAVERILDQASNHCGPSSQDRLDGWVQRLHEEQQRQLARYDAAKSRLETR